MTGVQTCALPILCGLRGNVVTAHICNRAWHRALRRVRGRLALHEWVSGNTLSLLECLFYRRARQCRVIAVSHRVARDLRTLYRCKAPMSVIYHGVDLATFAPALPGSRESARTECGLSGHEMAFFFVGDMRKGARQCIQALARLDFGKLFFVSRSPEAEYRSFAAKLGIGDRVRFLGTTTQVQKYYAAADALLLPSHYDSFAMVATEAMACALPVIVSREAGVAELIHHGVNGLLLDDYSDAAELAQKMHLLVNDRSLALRLGEAARHTVENHSWDATAERTMEVYRELCGKCGQGPIKFFGDSEFSAM